ncbi:MAG: hypothetical protein J0M08_05345 [Bacteroidetes bacterium]|nr:hypothetical protein [Bacteroidota bacterium]
MMNTINYIENNLNRISELSVLEKFDLIISSTNAINKKELSNVELIKKILTKIEALRYEMGYNKGIEAISGRLDKILAYEALKLARTIFNGKDLMKFINDVLYYEINEGFREELLKEIEGL